MQSSAPKKLLSYATYRLLHVANRLTRPLTMGVRAVVIDANDRVFLVRHSYVPGWHFPGGGVEPGETALESLSRELMEEGNIALDEAPKPLGLYFNDHATKRDHVMVYVARAFHQTAPTVAGAEIRETGFFPWNALPEGATRACRDRLAEIFSGAPVSERW
jgi:ADP-ribose pyrophosphatase YjhB (NUDIX family)